MREVDLNTFNQSLRTSAFWRQWMQARGKNPDGPIQLSDAERTQLQRDLERTGVQFRGNLEMDPAGNMNQNEGFGKQAKRWGPIVGAAALTLFGIPGVMPGLLSGGGAAAGGAAGAAGAGGGGALASSSVPTSAAMFGPAAIGSQGASAGIGLGSALASSSIPAAAAMSGPSTAAMGAQGASSGYTLPAALASGANAPGLIDRLTQPFTGENGGRNIAGLAALIPMLTGLRDQSSNGPFGNSEDLSAEIQRSLALQRQRVEQAQPVYDTLVRMAHGMSPAGYREPGATPTPYPYQAPRF